ncbi:MAG: hypothetical protein ACT4QC_11485 [Planctomycetaceae bacterium]
MRIVVLLLILTIMGCGTTIVQQSAPVDFSGHVTIAGSPATGVMLHFQPTGMGLPASFAVTNGQFNGRITPGKYTYFVTPDPDAESPVQIPQQYAEGHLDRQVNISGGSFDVKM